MDTEKDFFEESKQKMTEYVQDRLLLLKLEAVEKGSKLVAAMFSILIIALFAFFVLLFLSITAGYFFGEMLHHLSWGFGIVAGIYIALLSVVIVFRDKLLNKRIVDMVIAIVFEKASAEVKAEENGQ